MIPRKTIGRVAVGAALGLLATVAVATLWLRQDRTDVFYRVRGQLGEVRTLDRRELPGSRVEHLELINHRGEGVATAYLRRPRAPAAAPRALVTYVGYKTGDKLLDLIPERDDLVLVAVQYPFTSPETVAEFLRAPYELRRAVYRTVAGGMLAMSHLERQGLPPERVVVVGASLGTPFAVLHGALDQRVPRVLVIHGGGDLPLVIRTLGRRQGHPLRGEALAWIAEVLVASFDPVRHAAKISPRRLTILASRQDETFPVASVEALYRSAREPKEILWTATPHVRSRRPELVRQLVAQIEEALARDELPGAESFR